MAATRIKSPPNSFNLVLAPRQTNLAPTFPPSARNTQRIEARGWKGRAKGRPARSTSFYDFSECGGVFERRFPSNPLALFPKEMSKNLGGGGGSKINNQRVAKRRRLLPPIWVLGERGNKEKKKTGEKAPPERNDQTEK